MSCAVNHANELIYTHTHTHTHIYIYIYSGDFVQASGFVIVSAWAVMLENL